MAQAAIFTPMEPMTPPESQKRFFAMGPRRCWSSRDWPCPVLMPHPTVLKPRVMSSIQTPEPSKWNLELVGNVSGPECKPQGPLASKSIMLAFGEAPPTTS